MEGFSQHSYSKGDTMFNNDSIIARYGPPRNNWGVVAVHNRFADDPLEMLPETVVDEPKEIPTMLSGWLEETGLPWLRKQVKRQGVPNGKLFTKHTPEGYIIEARYDSGYIEIGAWRYDPPGSYYELAEIDETARWMGEGAIPKKGEDVFLPRRSLGVGWVIDYFVDNGQLGCRIRLTNPPGWFRNTHVVPWYMAKGEEIKLLKGAR